MARLCQTTRAAGETSSHNRWHRAARPPRTAPHADWIALVEAVRIELGPRADPERAIELAERMLREWPNDALAPETRELRCRALRQLGRAGECTASPPP